MNETDDLNKSFLVLFGLNSGLNNLKFKQEAIFAVDLAKKSWSDWVNPIRSIWLGRFDQKWLPGCTLSCLDLNCFQFGSFLQSDLTFDIFMPDCQTM